LRCWKSIVSASIRVVPLQANGIADDVTLV
jgi:hypothetical protein